MTYPTGTSDLLQWSRIINVVESSPWPHERILDVGAGWGKASVLLREMLNVKPREIHAIEPNRDAFIYTARGRALYDFTFPGMAAEFTEWAQYDTVLMADVLEHMPKDEGRALLDRIPGQVVISTPIDAGVAAHAADPEIPDLERHVSEWGIADFYATARLHSNWAVGGQLIVRLRPQET